MAAPTLSRDIDWGRTIIRCADHMSLALSYIYNWSINTNGMRVEKIRPIEPYEKAIAHA